MGVKQSGSVQLAFLQSTAYPRSDLPPIQSTTNAYNQVYVLFIFNNPLYLDVTIWKKIFVASSVEL